LELGDRELVLSEDHQIIYDGNFEEFVRDIEMLKKLN